MKISSMKMRMGPGSHLPFQLWWRTGQAPGKGPQSSLRKDSVTVTDLCLGNRNLVGMMTESHEWCFCKTWGMGMHQFSGEGLWSPLKVIQGWMSNGDVIMGGISLKGFDFEVWRLSAFVGFRLQKGSRGLEDAFRCQGSFLPQNSWWKKKEAILSLL